MTKAGAFGQKVTEATVNRLSRSLGHSDGEFQRGFFGRFAFASSTFGESGDGQIWPLTPDAFRATKNESLSNFHNEIFTKLGVRWNAIFYGQLNVPLYSGISFYLYLNLIGSFPAPWSLNSQMKLFHKIVPDSRIDWIDKSVTLNEIETQACHNEQIVSKHTTFQVSLI